MLAEPKKDGCDVMKGWCNATALSPDVKQASKYILLTVQQYIHSMLRNTFGLVKYYTWVQNYSATLGQELVELFQMEDWLSSFLQRECRIHIHGQALQERYPDHRNAFSKHRNCLTYLLYKQRLFRKQMAYVPMNFHPSSLTW